MSPKLPFGRPVEEQSGITPENLSPQMLQSRVPFVLRNFCSTWPLVQKGRASANKALGYLQQHYARVPVTATLVPANQNGRIFYNQSMSGFNFSANLESFSTFMKLLLNEVESPNPRGVYMASTDMANWFPGADKENDADLGHLDAIKLIWIGNRTHVAAHYDFTDNLACCVTGRRRFTLFPPEQIANLYPGPLEFAPGGQEISMVDFANPDWHAHPRFLEAIEAAQYVELSPGDALFLPGMWWHHVEGLDAVNILVSHWWRNSPAYLGRPSNALLHGVLSLASLSPELRSAWRSIFDYYVFGDHEAGSRNLQGLAKDLMEKPLSEKNALIMQEQLLKRLEKGSRK